MSPTGGSAGHRDGEDRGAPRRRGEPLDEYRRRRDFGRTPEPAADDDAGPAPGPGPEGGETAGEAGEAGKAPRFVVQQHSATRLHWDLRLEHEGVLLSWALPRGVPWDPAENHLAVHTEDHPLEYLTFAGDIPEGSYGAGTMTIWDEGRYTPEKVTDSEVIVTLAGRRVTGRHALFRTRGRDWMIHRMDPPADPDRRHLPDRFDLLSPVAGPVPRGDGWAIETFWQGRRGWLTASGGTVEITTPDGEEIGRRFPEVRRAGRALGMTEVALDGILTVTGDGPERVERRLAAGSESTWRRLARDAPVAFVAFDLLWLDGRPTGDLAWTDRRRLLDDLAFEGEAWSTPRAYTGEVAPIVEAAAGSGVQRLVAKRTDAPYDPGLDPPPWRTFTVAGG